MGSRGEERRGLGRREVKQQLWRSLQWTYRLQWEGPLMTTDDHHFEDTHASGNSQRMSYLQGSYLTLVTTFHPNPVNQDGSAPSVTDPLDCSDKDEDDI
ncbi:hypothetical protein EYF80_014537 [Liparis tanakae]|uniref:Uncharacterized protein n=1 Tax=Liparis tanakae TaxID=230148 RepID=A0A4Z2IBM6_9TELE|nr:hypothetical protein EYF80_014537 [Liparis tanakae]